ncbi:FAD-dependent oxidoreductase [Streptococcus cuniculipharyngis]|uniref:FAD/NAD(P)-binding domain-containing protein n=1 Tax=Streptococcus cuniculipharyngis TaxID=1562651 RepID=A0A5C5SGI8_9STRE|nr:FAD-dependent oxidoreductase [Streptococcus cuniculipharyngis]TWS99065.1 hypothetical protein FRX57_02350 [Streptococcus cuniculipharyngis]
MKILIIGASFAGLSAAVKARQLYPEADIEVLESRSQLPTVPNALNWSLTGKKQGWSKHFFSEELLLAVGIKLSLATEVVKILPESKRLILANGSSRCYDHLILAMGSTQKSHYIRGSELEGVFGCKDDQDIESKQEALAAANRVAIIGGGQIGIEASETYLAMGKEVYLFEANPSLDFKCFDTSFLTPLVETMETEKIRIFCGERVQAIELGTEGLVLVTARQRIAVDVVMLCAGLRPNTKLLQDLPILALDQTVQVDAYLQTVLPAIWAVGDLISLPLLAKDNMTYMPLANSALKTGELVAYNLTQPRYELPLSVRPVSSCQYGWYRTSLGLTAEEADLYQDISIVDYQAPFSLANPTPIYLRLIVASETGQILGAQALSKGDCSAIFQPLVYAMAEQAIDEQLAFQDFLFTAGEGEIFYHLHQLLLKSLDQRGA